MVTKRTTKAATAAKKMRPRAARPKAAARPRTFWDDLAEIGRKVPKPERALLPSAANFDDEFEQSAP